MVSRQHAEIEQIDKAYYIRDLDSTNGTYFNKQPVKKGKRVKLMVEDTITIGNQRLKIT